MKNTQKFLIPKKQFDVPGGNVQKTEDFVQAIFSFVLEQTKLDLKRVPLTYCGRSNGIQTEGKRTSHVFQVTINNNILEKLMNEDEFNRLNLRWVNQNDLMKNDIDEDCKREYLLAYPPSLGTFSNEEKKEDLSKINSFKKRVVINLFGNVGAGKGTQGELLSEKYKLPTISLGDLYRDENKACSSIGNLISLFYQTCGNSLFAPDEIAYGLLLKRISKTDCFNGFILDGFPRLVEQSKVYNNGFLNPNDIHIPIYLSIANNDIYSRLEGRFICSDCGKQARKHNNLEIKECCLHCGGKLMKRKEDIGKEKIDKRVEYFRENTSDLLASIASRDPITVFYTDNTLQVIERFKLIDGIVQDKLHLGLYRT